jgi:raffinose/stachyose/melibiose transport system permease protein
VLARLAGKPRLGARPYIPSYQGYIFILPGFLIYLIFVLVPIANTLRYSFYDWTGFSAPHYVGLDNYSSLIDDRLFWKALRHNVFFLGFYTILPILLGLFLTSLLTRSKLRGLAIFRAGLFIPQVMTPIAVGIIWRWLFALDGPINEFFRAVGAPGAARPWLGDFTYARYAVGSVGTWVEYGLCLMLFIAGAQSIDGELYDAAIAFGANGWQQFRYVTLPGLRQQILVAFIVTFIAGLRVFDLVFVLTRSGGPGTETTVASLLIYQQAFKFHKAGYAASMAVILTIIIVAVSALVLFFQSRDEGQEVSA